MRIHIHLLIHVVISQGAVFVAEQPAEALRERKGDDPAADKLIDGKRNRGSLDEVQRMIVKAVFFHGISFVELCFTRAGFCRTPDRISLRNGGHDHFGRPESKDSSVFHPVPVLEYITVRAENKQYYFSF